MFLCEILRFPEMFLYEILRFPEMFNFMSTEAFVLTPQLL